MTHTTTPRNRRSPTRTRLSVRLDTREREEIDQSVLAAGLRSPVRLLLSLIRQQARETAQIEALQAHMQAIVQTAVTAALGSLSDRLAADLAALSDALDERPTKVQMGAFLAHLRGQVST